MKKLYPLLLFCLLFNSSTFATVHYVNLYDYIYSGTPRYYDMDQDGDDDFSFTVSGYSYSVTGSKPSSKFAADGSNLPKAYSNGAAMGTYHWQGGTAVMFNYATSTGYFSTDRYLMVQFQNTGGQTFYGWFYIMNSGQTVAGYAYDDTPDQTIGVGQTFSGINNVLTEALTAATINAGFVSFSNCTGFDNAVVYTVDGKELANIKNPVAQQTYAIGQASGLLVIAFYRKEQLLASAKYVAK